MAKFNKFQNQQSQKSEQAVETKENPPVKELVEEKPKAGNQEMLKADEILDLPDELKQAIQWLGTQFKGIRQWTGRDGSAMATISLSTPAVLPAGFTSIQEIADEILTALQTIKEETGIAVFATYPIAFNRMKAEARVIKLQEDGKLACALNLEHILNGINSGAIVAMRRKEVVEADESGKGKPEATNFGFGKGLGI